jgi:glycosyltransferase involved in cell wall biosynthesis
MPDSESLKKVLIITYYWPPSGGSGVQRWLKFVKYLPQFAWQPYVFTPENPSFELRDESLLKDVPPEAEILHFPIWEPYSIFNRLAGNKGRVPPANSAPRPDSLFKKISLWIRGNLFIPDPRVFWVRPSVKFLNDFLLEQNIRTVITTGPPHSVHLIGLGLKKKNPSLRWIADFRDPWSEWGLLDTIKVGRLARSIHKRLERSVLQNADKVLTITPFYVKQLERLSGRKVHLLTNGFDEDDFRGLTIRPTEKFIIRHVGMVNEKCNPVPFMESVAALCESNEEFAGLVQIDFVGQVNPTFREFVTQHPVLHRITTFTDPIPHAGVIELYGQSSLLLLVLTGYKDAEGYMPGKLFEYMATGLPILGVGPEEGDAAKLLIDYGYGKMISSEKIVEIIQCMELVFKKKISEKISEIHVLGAANTQKYSRRIITGMLTDLI